MSPNEILSHFEHVQQVGGSQWRANCPACGDKKQHLYISFAPDGKALLDCKKQCAFSDIAAAAGIPQRDLFGENTQRQSWELLREHCYTNINGDILAKKQIYRKPDGKKTAIWYRLESGRYVKGLGGIKLPPYHLHKFTRTNGPLVIVEGEKDVETIERLGFSATTSPNGAGAKWNTANNGYLTGRNVVIIMDNDEAGEKYGRETAERIRTSAAAVKLLRSADIYPDVPHKGDISDIAQAVGDVEAKRLLAEAVAHTAEYTPPAPPPKPITYAEPAAPQDPDLIYIKNQLKTINPLEYAQNDIGNSALFANIFRDICRYNVTAKEWYIYEGGIWKEDTGSTVTARFAKSLHRELITFAGSITNEAQQRPFLENLGKMARLNVRKTILEDAREKYSICADDLDRDIWMYNCKNGTFDLRNGYFRKHLPGDLLSKISNVEYDPNTDCPDFQKFISEILLNDADKIRFMQTVFGYSLTGDTSEECFFILYGATTRNGKGTLMETIGHMMGGDAGYAATALPETFARKQNKDSRQASGDIARLKGVRFLNVSEPPRSMLFDAAQLKSLTGRDTIVARHLHQREIQFLPNFKLMMNTNWLPRIDDDTLFSSDRVHVVTFERHFDDNERDRKLKDRLRTPENISGLFNWCLKGLENWTSHGLRIPAVVKSATQQYRDISDKTQVFFNECMIPDTYGAEKAKDVYDVYRQWCRDNGYGVENKSNFFAGLRGKNLLTEQSWLGGMMTHNVIQGYRISDDYAHILNAAYSDPPPSPAPPPRSSPPF